MKGLRFNSWRSLCQGISAVKVAYICPKITWRLIHLDNRGFIVVFPYRGEQPRQTIVGEEDQHKKQHDGDIHRNLLHLLHWKEYRRDLRDFASA